MGLIQKKNDREEVDGIEIIGRGDTPGDIDENKVELVEGTSAEHMAAGTTAEKEAERAERKMVEDAADENLMPEDDEEDDDEEDEAAGCGKRQKIAIAIAVVAVIIAAVLGYFIGSGGFAHKGADSASLTSEQHDT